MKQNIKTLHIFPTVSPLFGGPIEAVRQLVKWYSTCHLDTNVDSTTIAIDIASLDRPSCNELSFPGGTVFPLNLRWYDQFIPLSLVKWLLNHVRNYDFVVIHGIWGSYFFSAWIMKFFSIPYAVYVHGMLDPWFKRRYPFKHIKKWFFWPWMVYPGLRNASAVFFTNEQERVLARQSFGLYRCHERILSYGTEGIPEPEHNYRTSFFNDNKLLQNRRCLLFLGRVDPKKGPDLLIRAISILRDKGIWNSNEHILVMAGPCDEPYAVSLKKLAARLKVTDSIYWTGMVLGSHKWGAFQAADAFILPSHQENYGIAIVEALSAAKPVLITHPINISNEIVGDGAGLVGSDTLEGVVDMINRWLFMDSKDKAIMSENALKCFRRRYFVKEFGESFSKYVLELKKTNPISE